MFETNVTVAGNVLTTPEWRRIESGALMAHFRVASTARRMERGSSRWVDGNNLRLRVTAWRKLAEGVASSIVVGDPVIVHGRLYTRDWKDDNGNRRVSFEVEATSIGHDLAKGRAKFFRSRPGGTTSEIEDAEGESFVGGEVSVPLTADEAPVAYGDGVPARFPDEDEPTFEEVVVGVSDEDELTAEVRQLTEVEPEPEPSAAESPRRGRRGGKREPVAA